MLSEVLLGGQEQLSRSPNTLSAATRPRQNGFVAVSSAGRCEAVQSVEGRLPMTHAFSGAIATMLPQQELLDSLVLSSIVATGPFLLTE